MIYVQKTEKVGLKFSELEKDNSKILFASEYLGLEICWHKNLDFYDSWLYQNRLVQIDQLDRKESLETISINRINFTYSSSRNIYK